MDCAFGNPDRYYSAAQPDSPRDGWYKKLEQRFAVLLERHDQELQQRVARTFKQWNGVLREYLRSETGLRLTVGEDAMAVPVRIRHGLPKPIADVLTTVD